MKHQSVYADFYDASALLRIHTDEVGSQVVREYVSRRPPGYTTPFCFYEAMNGLKAKWKYKNQLTKEQYLLAAQRLTAWFEATSRHIKDLDFSDLLVFSRTREIADRHGLDLSDAFQIMSVKHGFFSVLVGDSATLLVTCDKELFAAARAEGVRCWCALSDAPP